MLLLREVHFTLSELLEYTTLMLWSRWSRVPWRPGCFHPPRFGGCFLHLYSRRCGGLGLLCVLHVDSAMTTEENRLSTTLVDDTLEDV